jgi:response regulator NasT
MLEERPIPIVMLTAFGQRELVDRAAEAGCLRLPGEAVPRADVVPAIERRGAATRSSLAVRADADSLSQALADRKVIERAKGSADGAREAEARPTRSPRLRKASQVSGRPCA